MKFQGYTADELTLRTQVGFSTRVSYDEPPALDKETIANRVKEIAGAQGIELVKANRGALMRSISAELKGKADMKIVSAVVGDILN